MRVYGNQMYVYSQSWKFRLYNHEEIVKATHGFDKPEFTTEAALVNVPAMHAQNYLRQGRDKILESILVQMIDDEIHKFIEDECKKRNLKAPLFEFEFIKAEINEFYP